MAQPEQAAEAAEFRATYADFVHTGPGTDAGRYLRQFWQPVMLSRELVAGRAKPLQVLGEKFTAYRGEGGTAHIVAARCAHRGNPMWTGWVEGDSIRCLYHGWKYDETGSCREQPAEQDGGQPERVAIRAYPTREYLGLVFVFFGEGPVPELPHFNAYDQPGVIETQAVFRACNYFNQMENSVDETHFNFVHRKSDFSDTGFNDTVPRISGKETDYGILRIGERNGVQRITHLLMPNALYAMIYFHSTGWAEHMTWRVPYDDDHHISFMVDMIHVEGDAREAYLDRRQAELAHLATLPDANEIVARILRGEIHLSEVEDRPDLLNIQDLVALVGQGTEIDRSRDMLVRSDIQIAMLRRIWTREINALREGRPIKQWQWPPDLVLTSGV